MLQSLSSKLVTAQESANSMVVLGVAVYADGERQAEADDLKDDGSELKRRARRKEFGARFGESLVVLAGGRPRSTRPASLRCS